MTRSSSCQVALARILKLFFLVALSFPAFLHFISASWLSPYSLRLRFCLRFCHSLLLRLATDSCSFRSLPCLCLLSPWKQILSLVGASASCFASLDFNALCLVFVSDFVLTTLSFLRPARRIFPLCVLSFSFCLCFSPRCFMAFFLLPMGPCRVAPGPAPGRWRPRQRYVVKVWGEGLGENPSDICPKRAPRAAAARAALTATSTSLDTNTGAGTSTITGTSTTTSTSTTTNTIT